MAKYNISKETALPGTLQPNTIYYVSTGADKVEIYVTGTSASTVRRVLNETDIQALINASISGLSGLQIVPDIPARDALNPSTNVQVLVEDASSDATVTSGAATYVYDFSNTTWIKIAEHESQDLVLDWANIQNRPSSTASQIDAAVTNSHTHSNKTQLDQLGQDGDGELTYNGSKVATEWTNIGW